MFSTYANSNISNGVVFIDALDEKRSRGDDPDSINGIIEKIVALKPSKVRISCRSLDWLGETDLVLFRPYFENNGGYAVVKLEHLSEDEQLEILSDLGVIEPKQFVQEAGKKGLHSLLSNPQTLQMLEKAVQGGTWPDSRFETFQKATSLLLIEHNSQKQSKISKSYSLDELLEAAGAVCASMLVSDTAGVSLQPSSVVADYPSFDQVPFEDKAIVAAALQSRVFEHLRASVAFASHRTIAEYLGARWLAEQVKNGLPLDRVLSLITVDGYPALELRGLYAWLPSFLPNHAIRLIKGDPLAVTMYGDPKTLSTELRLTLIKSIQDHSAHDPWFNRGDIEQETLGNLSGHDMIDVFRTLLNIRDENYRLRVLILDAIENGPQVPALLNVLIGVLKNCEATYVERERAFRAAVAMSPEGIEKVAEVTKVEFLSDRNNCRLAANVIREYYPGFFTPDDIAQLVSVYLSETGSRVLGELWFVHEKIPDEELDDVLDKVSNIIGSDKNANWQSRSEVANLFSELLIRVIELQEKPKAEKLYYWLSALHLHGKRDSYGSSRTNPIRDWLKNHPDLVRQMCRIAFDQHAGQRWWMFWHDFRGAVFHAFDLGLFVSDLLDICLDHAVDVEKRNDAYSLLISYAYQCEPVDIELFNVLFELSSHETFTDTFLNAASMPVESWHHEDAVRSIETQRKQEHRQKKTKEDFDKENDLIINGDHMGWMSWISRVYYGRFSDTDKSQNKHDRLVAELGEDRAGIAEAGMENLIYQTDKLPNTDSVLDLRKKNKYQPWWYAIIGGLDLLWQNGQSIREIPDTAIAAGLAVEMHYPVWDQDGNQISQTKHGWIEAAYSERQSLVLEVFEKCARFDLECGRDSSDAIFRLSTEDTLKKASAHLLFSLLKVYPNSKPNLLRRLLSESLQHPELRSELPSLLTEVVSDLGKLEEEQQTIWLGAAFSLEQEKLPDALIRRFEEANDTDILWSMKRAVSEFRDDEDSGGFSGLSTDRVRILAELFGTRFPIEESPEGGWSGDNNNWDANEYVRHLINELSGRTDDKSIDALRQLSENHEMVGYRRHLLHARANQATLFRQKRYVQPGWNETVDALHGGLPANMADLLSLTVDHLHTVQRELQNNNIDALKVFWNEDRYGRITNPKPEESARDALVMHLRPVFEPQKVRVEPEGHMNQDKRADMIVLPPPGQKLPVELKRDYHSDVWSACHTQLDRLYTRDPEAEGHGIFAVFWYGVKRPKKIPKPPENIKMPTSAKEMETALRSLIPVDKRTQLKAVVLDVSQVV